MGATGGGRNSVFLPFSASVELFMTSWQRDVLKKYAMQQPLTFAERAAVARLFVEEQKRREYHQSFIGWLLRLIRHT